MNIKSPATKALLNLAAPVKISPEEVIITFKNDKLVSQINDTNKKQMLVEAANTMFNQSSTHITIRLPQPGDSELQKKTAPAQPKLEVQPIKAAAEEVHSAPPEEKIITEEFPSPKATEEKPKNKERLESDQEKMVLELFDGKFIE